MHTLLRVRLYTVHVHARVLPSGASQEASWWYVPCERAAAVPSVQKLSKVEGAPVEYPLVNQTMGTDVHMRKR